MLPIDSTMLDIFIITVLLSACALVLLFTFWIGQMVVERFILSCLPVIIELYGRVRYPDEFKEE